LDLHKRDVSLLLNLQQGLGGIGSINSNLNKVTFAVNYKQDLKKTDYSFRKISFINTKSSRFYII
jgi:hypothetical protein